MSVTRIEDIDPSTQPIIERAWRAFMEDEQLDSVTMTASEYEQFWKGLGYREDPAKSWPTMVTLYGVPIVVTPHLEGLGAGAPQRGERHMHPMVRDIGAILLAIVGFVVALAGAFGHFHDLTALSIVLLGSFLMWVGAEILRWGFADDDRR